LRIAKFLATHLATARGTLVCRDSLSSAGVDSCTACTEERLLFHFISSVGRYVLMLVHVRTVILVFVLRTVVCKFSNAEVESKIILS
jgi:hypothetical protein